MQYSNAIYIMWDSVHCGPIIALHWDCYDRRFNGDLFPAWLTWCIPPKLHTAPAGRWGSPPGSHTRWCCLHCSPWVYIYLAWVEMITTTWIIKEALPSIMILVNVGLLTYFWESHFPQVKQRHSSGNLKCPLPSMISFKGSVTSSCHCPYLSLACRGRR